MEQQVKIAWGAKLNAHSAKALLETFGENDIPGYRQNNVRIDFDNHTEKTIRPLFKDLIDKKIIELLRVKYIGKKRKKEICEWCGAKD